MTRGRFAESRRRLQIAAELDPLSLGPQLNQVAELVEEHKDDEAKRIVNNVLNVAPNSPAALALGLRVAFWQKDCATVTQLGQKIVALYPKSANATIVTMFMSAACGRADLMAADLATLAKMKPSVFPSPYQVADVFSIGQDADQAISFLKLSADRHEPALMSVAVDRAFEPLRHDARFIALERRLGLIE